MPAPHVRASAELSVTPTHVLKRASPSAQLATSARIGRSQATSGAPTARMLPSVKSRVSSPRSFTDDPMNPPDVKGGTLIKGIFIAEVRSSSATSRDFLCISRCRPRVGSCGDIGISHVASAPGRRDSRLELRTTAAACGTITPRSISQRSSPSSPSSPSRPTDTPDVCDPPRGAGIMVVEALRDGGHRHGSFSGPDQFARLMDELRIIVPAVGRNL